MSLGRRAVGPGLGAVLCHSQGRLPLQRAANGGCAVPLGHRTATPRSSLSSEHTLSDPGLELKGASAARGPLGSLTLSHPATRGQTHPPSHEGLTGGEHGLSRPQATLSHSRSANGTLINEFVDRDCFHGILAQVQDHQRERKLQLCRRPLLRRQHDFRGAVSALVLGWRPAAPPGSAHSRPWRPSAAGTLHVAVGTSRGLRAHHGWPWAPLCFCWSGGGREDTPNCPEG